MTSLSDAAPPDASDDLPAAVPVLERRRERLRLALARAEVDRASLQRFREGGGRPPRGGGLARAAVLTAARLLLGAALGAGIAFLIACSIVRGALG